MPTHSLELAALDPAQPLVPWCIIFAAAIASSAIGLPQHRLTNPIVLTLWFSALTYASWLGTWGLLEINAGLLCLAGPHTLLAITAGRRTSPQREEAGERHGHEDPDASHEPHPFPGPGPSKDSERDGLRRVA